MTLGELEIGDVFMFVKPLGGIARNLDGEVCTLVDTTRGRQCVVTHSNPDKRKHGHSTMRGFTIDRENEVTLASEYCIIERELEKLC
jgi:hypothetical protein